MAKAFAKYCTHGLGHDVGSLTSTMSLCSCRRVGTGSTGMKQEQSGRIRESIESSALQFLAWAGAARINAVAFWRPDLRGEVGNTFGDTPNSLNIQLREQQGTWTSQQSMT